MACSPPSPYSAHGPSSCSSPPGPTSPFTRHHGGDPDFSSLIITPLGFSLTKVISQAQRALRDREALRNSMTKRQLMCALAELSQVQDNFLREMAWEVHRYESTPTADTVNLSNAVFQFQAIEGRPPRTRRLFSLLLELAAEVCITKSSFGCGTMQRCLDELTDWVEHEPTVAHEACQTLIEVVAPDKPPTSDAATQLGPSLPCTVASTQTEALSSALSDAHSPALSEASCLTAALPLALDPGPPSQVPAPSQALPPLGPSPEYEALTRKLDRLQSAVERLSASQSTPLPDQVPTSSTGRVSSGIPPSKQPATFPVVIKSHSGTLSSSQILSHIRRSVPTQDLCGEITRIAHAKGRAIIKTTTATAADQLQARIRSRTDLNVFRPRSKPLQVIITHVPAPHLLQEVFPPLAACGPFSYCKTLPASRGRRHWVFSTHDLQAAILATSRSIIIGLTPCKVKPCRTVPRCRNCQRFGHPTAQCKNPAACGTCSGSHETRACQSQHFGCINCASANGEGAKRNIAHPASSLQCPTFIGLRDQPFGNTQGPATSKSRSSSHKRGKMLNHHATSTAAMDAPALEEEAPNTSLATLASQQLPPTSSLPAASSPSDSCPLDTPAVPRIQGADDPNHGHPGTPARDLLLQPPLPEVASPRRLPPWLRSLSPSSTQQSLPPQLLEESRNRKTPRKK